METIDKLLEIAHRIDHVETSGQWIAKETIHSDNGVSQTGTLISVLADELREKVYALVHELEQVSAEYTDPQKLH